MCVGECIGLFLRALGFGGESGGVFFLHVGLFKAVVVLAVEHFQPDAEEDGEHAECGEDEHRHEVAAGGVECLAYEQRHEAEADVLYPEYQAVGRAEDIVVDDLGNGRPQGGWHEREADAEHEYERHGQPHLRNRRQQECEAEVAARHDNGADDKHRGSVSLIVEERAEEGGQYHSQDGEDAEEARCRLGAYAEGLLHVVGSVALEGEDAAVVEHTQQGYEPEHLAAEYLAEVGDVELLVLAAGVLAVKLAGGRQLTVELAVHEHEHGVAEQAYDEQGGAECHGSQHRLVEHAGNQRRNPHHCEYAQTRDRHLHAHRQRHLLAFEPLRNGLGDGCAGHLAAAAEDHEAQRRHLGAAREAAPPAVEPAAECRGLEPLADTYKLDGRAYHHQRCRKQTREADAGLVKDYACENKEEEKHVQEILRSGVGAECGAVPVQFFLKKRLQGRHDVDEHVGEEHH